MTRDPRHARDLIDRAARCIAALTGALRGKPTSAEALPAADDLLRELRVFLLNDEAS